VVRLCRRVTWKMVIRTHERIDSIQCDQTGTVERDEKMAALLMPYKILALVWVNLIVYLK